VLAAAREVFVERGTTARADWDHAAELALRALER
jgi:hypothetical protein